MVPGGTCSLWRALTLRRLPGLHPLQGPRPRLLISRNLIALRPIMTTGRTRGQASRASVPKVAQKPRRAELSSSARSVKVGLGSKESAQWDEISSGCGPRRRTRASELHARGAELRACVVKNAFGCVRMRGLDCCNRIRNLIRWTSFCSCVSLDHTKDTYWGESHGCLLRWAGLDR